MSDEIGKSLVSQSILSHLYSDAIQPSAKRVGMSLETITKVTLSPVLLLDWGYEKSKDWLRAKIDARLAETPSEYVVYPKGNIASAALTHIAISYDTPELRELYAELLLKALDTRTADRVHPAYFYVIEQLSPQEALVLVALHELDTSELFSEKTAPWGGTLSNEGVSVERQFSRFCDSKLPCNGDQSIWLANVCRLGLLVLDVYPEAVLRPEESDRRGVHPAQVDNYEHRTLAFTEFGKAFIRASAPDTDLGGSDAA